MPPIDQPGQPDDPQQRAAGDSDAADAPEPGPVGVADPFAGLPDQGPVAVLRDLLAEDLDLVTVRALTAAATIAAARVGDVCYQAPRKQLSDLVGELGHLAAVCTAGQVVVTADADRDGVIAASTCRSTTGWVRDADWHLTVGGVSTVLCKGLGLRSGGD